MSSSKQQMWITANGEKEKIQLPVHPEQITLRYGSNTKSVDISGLGEIIISQDRKAIEFSFNSFFPAAGFPGMRVKRLTPPRQLKATIKKWRNSNKPVRFMITGTDVNLYGIIDDFSCEERGNDPGTVYYSMKIKEYREITARKVKVSTTTKKATVPAKPKARTDNRVQPKTYTVKSGDNLWNIAAKYLGKGSRYLEIYNLNKDKIKNPSLIYPGQVLRLSK